MPEEDAIDRFVRESREIDEAYRDGTLGEWVQRKLDAERAKYSEGSSDPRDPEELAQPEDGTRGDDAG